jgi:flagellar motor switch protein FliN/FliY
MIPDEETASAQDLRRNIDLLKDVTLQVKVELGRGKMYLKDVLRLTAGSVVELDKMAGDPVEIFANERLVGRGEVLVLNENFCVRVTQIFSPEECLRIKGAS